MGDGRGLDGGRLSVQCWNLALSWNVHFVCLLVYIVTWGDMLSNADPYVVYETHKRYMVTEETFQHGTDNTSYQEACGKINAEMAVIDTNAMFSQVQSGISKSNMSMKSFFGIYIFLQKYVSENGDIIYYWAKEEVASQKWWPGDPNGVDWHNGRFCTSSWCLTVALWGARGFERSLLTDSCCTRELHGLCVQDVDECEDPDLYSCPDNSFCMNTDGNYTCKCESGFIDFGGVCKDIDECENITLSDCPEHSKCVNQEGNYTCDCDPGYTNHGDLCVDVDECANSTLFKCPELSNCNNTDGGYTCICQDGYFTNESGLCEDVDKVGLTLRVCPCVCSKAVTGLEKNLSNLMKNWEYIKKKTNTIQEKLQVKKVNLTSDVRRKTSATDERGSSASFGVIALTLLGLELFLITLGDIIVVALYIKQKVVTLFCATVGMDEQTGERTVNQSKQLGVETAEREGY